MISRNGLHISYIVLTLLFITGCASINKSYPERNFYMFEVPPNTEKYTPVKGAILEVWRFDVSPGSEGKEFISRISDLEYKSAFYNQFFSPPTALLTEVTTRYLDGSGLFMDVLSPGSQGDSTYYIEGNVVRLYGDYRAQPKAVMEIQFFLLQYESDITEADASNIVFGKTYISEKPIASAMAQDLMKGWNLALEEILNEFLTGLSKSVNREQGV